MIKNGFGKGKTYLFSFDVLKNQDSSKIAGMISDAFSDTVPDIESIPYSPKVFELSVKANVVPLFVRIDTSDSNATPFKPESYPYNIYADLELSSTKLIFRFEDENTASFNISLGYMVREEIVPAESFFYQENITATQKTIEDITAKLDSYLAGSPTDAKIIKAKEFLQALKEGQPDLANDDIVRELLKIIKDVVARESLTNQTRGSLSRLVMIYDSRI